MSRRDTLLFFLLLAATSLAVYWPALGAPFVSDDLIYLPFNPWVQEISAANVWAMFDPASSNNHVTANYAPTQMLVHMLQWAVFGEATPAYRVMNFGLHALCGVLFAAWLRRAGAPAGASAAAAALFLFHPASAEVASWISQLKTLLAMTLALGALLLRLQRPRLAAGLFLAGLFAKPMAAVALPVVIAEEWLRRGNGDEEVDRFTLVCWSLAFASFAGVALFAYQSANVGIPPVSDDPLLRWLSVPVFGARYLVMAFTTYGVSAWQEPPAATGPSDPWVWLALGLGALFGWRLFVSARDRLPELPFWVWAAAAFAPVAQVFPFRYPMADRYLYFILPGLIGGVWIAGARAWPHLPDGLRRAAPRALVVAGVAVLGAFAVASWQRAVVWSTPSGPSLDATAHWPEGAQAQREQGRRAAYAGQWDVALPLLEFAAERRVLTLPHILEDSILGPLIATPQFQPLLLRIARREIELMSDPPQTTEYGLIRLAQAQLVAREFDDAETSLQQAAALEGSYGPLIAQLRMLALARRPFAAAPR